MRLRHIFWLVLFSLGLNSFLSPPASAIEARVLIIESASRLTLSSPTRLQVSGCFPSPCWYPPHEKLHISSDAGGLRIDGQWVACTGGLKAETDPASYVQVNQRSYRGTVEICKQNGKETLQAINILDLEEYLRGVIAEEISPQWPMEALKAQAVVARTFALRQILDNPEQLFHLKNTNDSQMYGGKQAEDSRSDLAVQETAGLVLTYQGRAIPTFYHAACGGHTEDVSEVWSYNHPSLQGVPCSYCEYYPVYAWQVSLKGEDIRQALLKWGFQVGEIEAIFPLNRTMSKRIRQLEIKHSWGRIIMEGKRFRQCLGYDLIRSTNFTIKWENGIFTFQGKGWGHGVGLCQWGAKGMADRAFSYEVILQHYYPGTRLSRIEEIGD